MITIKSKDDFGKMRRAGRIIADLFDLLPEYIESGVTTLELDRIAEKHIRSLGAIPAFKGYHDFPATLCTSVNDEVVHGIPSDRKLVNGDIVSVDVGTIVEGFYADAARTFAVGEIPDDVQLLIDVTKHSLDCGIQKAKSGNRVSDISNAVQVAIEPHGFGIVRQYVGHGIGADLHEEPQIPNFGEPGKGSEIKEGMAFAIEPMVTLGSEEVKVLSDDWTVATKDGQFSAHFENTVLVTNNGFEVITNNA